MAVILTTYVRPGMILQLVKLQGVVFVFQAILATPKIGGGRERIFKIKIVTFFGA